MAIKFKDRSNNGRCSRCGQCCGNYLPMTEHEVQRIKTYIKKRNIQPANPYLHSLEKDVCPFRDEENKTCVIYSIRPDICRNFRCWDSDPKRLDNLAKHTVRVVHVGCEFYGRKL